MAEEEAQQTAEEEAQQAGQQMVEEAQQAGAVKLLHITQLSLLGSTTYWLMVLAHTSHASSPTRSRTGFYPANSLVPLGVLGRSLPPTKLLPCSKEAKSPCPITGRLGLVATLLSRHNTCSTCKNLQNSY